MTIIVLVPGVIVVKRNAGRRKHCISLTADSARALGNTVVDDGFKYRGYLPPFARSPGYFLSFSGNYQDTLIACLTDNPRPVMFPVSCSGAAPRVVLEGPWDEVLAKERDALEELGSPKVGASSSSAWGAIVGEQERLCTTRSSFVVWRGTIVALALLIGNVIGFVLG